MWKWHWNPMIGIMFGPIPVGLLIVLAGAVVYFAFFNK
jgi:hypothetical protein